MGKRYNKVYKYRECKHEFVFSKYCGCYVCVRCRMHSVDSKGMRILERCFCGWSLTGRNGYREMLEMGEVIEPWDY